MEPKHLMDTQELSEIRALLSDAPTDASHSLDAILSEASQQATAESPSQEEATAEQPKEQALSETEKAYIEADLPFPVAKRRATPNTMPKEEVRPQVETNPIEHKTKPAKAKKPVQSPQKQKPSSERMTEEQEEMSTQPIYKPQDPKLAQKACVKRVRSLSVRQIPVVLCFLFTAYCTVAPVLPIPIPDLFLYTKNPISTVLTCLLLQVLAMLFALDCMGGGIASLLRAKPNRATLVALANLSTLVVSIGSLLSPNAQTLMPYTSVAILLLFAHMREEIGMTMAKRRAFKVSTLTATPTGVFYAQGITSGRIARKYALADTSDFLIELEKPDMFDRSMGMYIWLMLLGCTAFSVWLALKQGGWTVFVLTFSHLLCMGAGLGVLTASGAVWRHVSRRLLGEGASLARIETARTLEKTKFALVSDADIFPAGSIIIDGLQQYGNYSAEKLLAYASAVTCGDGIAIGRVFAESLRENYGRPVKASNILRYESGGLSAEIGMDSVLVGTASFMRKFHIPLRDNKGVENGVYLAINSQVAGVFSLTYHATAPCYRALHALRRMHMRPLLETHDFNLSASMIDSLFELRSGRTAQANVPLMQTPQDTLCGILSHNGLSSFTQLLHSAHVLAQSVRKNMQIGIFSSVCGAMLLAYLHTLSATQALVPSNVLAYLLLWYFPIFLMVQSAKRRM